MGDIYQTDQHPATLTTDNQFSTNDQTLAHLVSCHIDVSGASIYEEYFSQVVQRILKPFSFASIGFSIPISQMFDRAVAWRGLVFSILMLLGEILTGLWLVRMASPSLVFESVLKSMKRFHSGCWTSCKQKISGKSGGSLKAGDTAQAKTIHTGAHKQTSSQQTNSRITQNSLSLYPASVLGAAMVSRGEIGFLIASLAERKGIFDSHVGKAATAQKGSSQLFLIVVWAITLCTIIGPLGVGLLLKRVRKLEKKQDPDDSAVSPLGFGGCAKDQQLYHH